MATYLVKQGLKGLTSEALVEKGYNCVVMCTAAAWLTLPALFLASMKTAIDEFKEVSEEVLFNGGRITFQLKRSKEVIVIKYIRELAAHVQAQSAGDEAKILSAGFEVRKRGTPVETLDMPLKLRTGFTLFTGNVDLRWDRVVHAVNYEVSVNTGDPAVENGWTVVLVSSRTRVTITDLAPATVCNFRVQAIGRKGLRSPASQVIKALVAA